MTSAAPARIPAGFLLIAVPLVFTAGFTGLQMTFDYPDILRHPAGEVLTRFASAGWDLHAYWYAMMAAALGMIPASVLAALHFWQRDNVLAALSAAFGVLAGLVQALGLIRWVVLVPGLASAYVAPGATDLDRSIAVSIFDATNLYLGVGVGEHLGYLFTGVWTLLVAALIFPRSPHPVGHGRSPQPRRHGRHARALRRAGRRRHQRHRLLALGAMGSSPRRRPPHAPRTLPSPPRRRWPDPKSKAPLPCRSGARLFSIRVAYDDCAGVTGAVGCATTGVAVSVGIGAGPVVQQRICISRTLSLKRQPSSVTSRRIDGAPAL